MVQELVAYAIVTAATVWLVWTLVLPEPLRRRLRPGREHAAGGPTGGCAGCSGCPVAGCARDWRPATSPPPPPQRAVVSVRARP